VISPKNTNSYTLLHSLTVVMLCAVIVFEFGFILIETLRSLYDFDPRFTAALIAFSGTVWATLFAHGRVKEREIEARQFPEKSAAYDIIITLLIDSVRNVKTGDSIPEKELLDRMFEFKKKLIVWGGDGLINSWNDFEISYDSTANPEVIILTMENLLRAIRKDLGHKDRNLKKFALWALFLIKEDKEKILGTD